MSIKVEEAYRRLRRKLADITGSDGEATAMARLIFRELKGWDTTGLVVHAADTLSDFTTSEIDRILERLASGEPLQYILGRAHFYGMDLRVDHSTLIPRPETEELVDLIVNDYRGRRDMRVLDVGTGSGAIAIALSRNLEFPQVTAIDVNPDTLRIARLNGEDLHADIHWIEADIFSYSPPRDSLDLIVSNPPYVMEMEKSDMERHVLEHEPARALFVPDEDPLLFYRRIADIGRDALSLGGAVYFEINPLTSNILKDMMESMGYNEVTLHQDMSHKDRFLSAMRQ